MKLTASCYADLEREEVKRLKAYRLGMVDLFEGTPACYPGFLTSKWYPSRLPDTLRKLLLSGYTHQLQASSGMVQPPSLHSHACQLADTLAKVVTAEFEMPEQRRKWQERMKEGRQLAAAQRYWVKQGGWTSQHEGSTVTCRQGAWSVQLTEQLLHSGSLRFAGMVVWCCALPPTALPCVIPAGSCCALCNLFNR
jgi:hypothetical protein